MPLVHYHMNQGVSKEVINILEVDQDFFMRFNPWKQPEGFKKIGEIPFKEQTLTYADFKKRVGGNRFDEEQTFMQKVKAVFS